LYGVINKSLKEMVIEQFGMERWESILERSGVPVDSFLSMRSYDDQRTYALAQGCADELGIPLADALRAFGAHWIEHTVERDYSALVSAAGNSLVEFLNNLNALHDKISSTFLDYRPPTFDVTLKGDHEVDILYTSERMGLTPFVEGLMIALGKRFNEPVEVLSIEAMPVDSGEQSRFSIRLG